MIRQLRRFTTCESPLTPRHMPPVHRIIRLENVADRQFVRTARDAGPAFGAEGHRFHGFPAEIRRNGRRHARGNDRVAHGRGDHHPLGAGLAVFAAAAEPFAQLAAVLFHDCQVLRGDDVVAFVE